MNGKHAAIIGILSIGAMLAYFVPIYFFARANTSIRFNQIVYGIVWAGYFGIFLLLRRAW